MPVFCRMVSGSNTVGGWVILVGDMLLHTPCLPTPHFTTTAAGPLALPTEPPPPLIWACLPIHYYNICGHFHISTCQPAACRGHGLPAFTVRVPRTFVLCLCRYHPAAVILFLIRNQSGPLQRAQWRRLRG